MASKMLPLLATLSLASASCLSGDIRRAQNPTHTTEFTPPYAPAGPSPSAPRLLFIGDVHGMANELEALLDKADFSTDRGDRVIFAGDMINKGPDNARVVELAMRINASSVRGNHEDRVLRAWAGAEIARTLAEANDEDPSAAVAAYEASLSNGGRFALKTARELSDEQRRWLADRPLALTFGSLPGLGELAVAHGGMAPGITLADQEDWPLYNVRSVVYPDAKGSFASSDEAKGFKKSVESKLADFHPGRKPTAEEVEAEMARLVAYYAEHADVPAIPIDTTEGRWWVEAWNEVEKAKPQDERLTVVYGHDSKRGINIYDYSKGLDSRCVNGGKLTAWIVQPDEDICDDGEEEEVLLKTSLVDVQCVDGDIEPK